LSDIAARSSAGKIRRLKCALMDFVPSSIVKRLGD